MVDLTGWVLGDGDHVAADGRVVADADAAWFEPPLPRPLGPGGFPSVRPPSHLAVRLHGVRLADLPMRPSGGRRVEAHVGISGTWQADELHVTEQRSATTARESWSPRSRPPCPPPAGGWPRGGDDQLAPPDELLARDEVTSAALFWPTDTQPVLVVAAVEPARVAARLHADYGDRLCLVRSRWAGRQIRDVRHALDAAADAWTVYESATTVGGDGQAVIEANVVRVGPELAAWAARQPDGLLDVSAWLLPSR